jgi:thymidylate synthase
MNTLDEQYINLLQDILDNGIKKKDRTGTGTLSVFGHQIRHNMPDGFPLLTTKKMAWKTIVTELLWFLRGDTNIKYLLENDCHIWTGDAYKKYKQKLDKHYVGGGDIANQKEFEDLILTNNEFSKEWGELGLIYGSQWRDWGGKNDVKLTDKRDKNGYLKFEKTHINGIDQIKNIILELKTNPDSRRLLVNAWNVGELDKMVLPPCHYGFQVYTRELTGEERWDLLKKKVGEERFKSMVDDIVPFGGGLSEELQSYKIPKRALSLMWNQRSVDTFLGLPFNISSYGLLLEIIARMVNMVPDELIGNLGDVHLYSDHVDQAREQMGRTSYDLPKLIINSGNENWSLLELDEIINTFDPDITFKVENYKSHPSIKAPLSN